MCMKCGCSTPNDKKTGGMLLPNGKVNGQSVVVSSDFDQNEK